MQRHVRLVPDDPAVVRNRRDVERLSRTELEHTAIVEGRRRDAAEDEPDVLDLAACFADRRADVLGPSPARLVLRTPNGDSANPDGVEPALWERSRFVWLVESFQDDGDIVQPQRAGSARWRVTSDPAACAPFPHPPPAAQPRRSRQSAPAPTLDPNRCVPRRCRRLSTARRRRAAPRRGGLSA
jgi:hypothetical protein